MSFAIAHAPSGISLTNPTYEARRAVGSLSLKILDLITEVNKENDRSILLGWRASVRGQLSEIVANYATIGWDGEDALPISVEAATTINSLIDALPDDVIPPEVTPEINGRISLDWNLGTNRILTMSVSKDTIIYAAIVGTRKIHGESTSIYEIPQEVKNILPGYFSRLS